MLLNENEKRKVRSFDRFSFEGINTRRKISDNELADCKNLSSNMYPCLAPRDERVTLIDGMKGISNLAAPKYNEPLDDGFTGIMGKNFCYKGTVIDNLTLSEGRKSVARLGDKIFIFPDKLYFDCSAEKQRLEKMEQIFRLDHIGTFTTIDPDTGDYKSVIKTNAYFEPFFHVGDSIIIENCPVEIVNTAVPGRGTAYPPEDRVAYMVIQSIVQTTLHVKLYNCTGQEIGFPQNGAFYAEEDDFIIIKTFVPDMAQVCVSGGRLWGTSSDGQYIFASAKADALSYNTLTKGENDSWFGVVDNDNPFTGIIGLNGSLVAFKNDALFQVYGDRPKNFSLKQVDLWGSADERSVATLGNSVYYLGNHGFYRYSGGNPKLISDNLTRKYTGCVGGSDGQKYYACAYFDGGCEILVYDPRYGVWYREDSEPFVDFISRDGVLYGATSEKVVKMYGGAPCDWYAVGKRYTHGEFDLKQLGFIYIRAEMPTDDSGIIRVSVRVDDGEFEELDVIRGKGFIARQTPVRLPKCDSYQIRLDGKGGVIIHDIKRVLV